MSRSQALAENFVIDEKECFVFLNRPSHCTAQLSAMEWWHLWSVEKVSRVKACGTQESVGIAVKLVRSRTSNGTDQTSRGSSIFRRMIARDNGELRDSIDA